MTAEHSAETRPVAGTVEASLLARIDRTGRATWLTGLQERTDTPVSVTEPHASPVDDGPLLDELTAREARWGSDEFSLRLYADRIDVVGEGESYVYDRTEFAARTRLRLFPGGRGTLVLDGREAGLTLERFELQQLREWMGPALGDWARVEAFRNAQLSVVGGLAILGLYWIADGWYPLVYGLAASALGIANHYRPGRWLYLARAGNSTLVGVLLAIEFHAHTTSPWSALFGSFLFLAATSSLRKYHFFTPSKALRNPFPR